MPDIATQPTARSRGSDERVPDPRARAPDQRKGRQRAVSDRKRGAVREALRLLKVRDQARELLRADVQSGFSQLLRDEGVVDGDPAAVKALASRIKVEGRKSRERKRWWPYGCLRRPRSTWLRHLTTVPQIWC